MVEATPHEADFCSGGHCRSQRREAEPTDCVQGTACAAGEELSCVTPKACIVPIALDRQNILGKAYFLNCLRILPHKNNLNQLTKI